MDKIQGISYGKLSKTIITDSTKWVKIDYAGPEGKTKRALFMGSSNLGYSGWLGGGNKKMYETIKQKYSSSISNDN